MTYPVKHVPTKRYYFCSANPTKWNTSEMKMIAYTDIKEAVFDDEKRDFTLPSAWRKLVNKESIGFGGDTIPPADQWQIPYTANVNHYLTREQAQTEMANFLKSFANEKYTVKKLELK